MEENKKAIDYLEEIMSKEKIQLLKNISFFTSPASSKYHLSVPGGLAQHSVNVTNTMIKLNEDMKLGLKREDIIMAGMLHDLTKSGSYKNNVLKSGNVSNAQPYKTDKNFTLGHSAESIYLITNDLGIKLPVYVAEAIYWHMGFDYAKDGYNIEILKKQPIDILFVWLMQTADLYATWIIEG